MAKMEITFPGNKKVNALFQGFEIKTDQSIMGGGEGTAPEPYHLFLASIGTCAGIFAISFFQTRNLNTEGFKMYVDFKWNKEKHILDTVETVLILPKDFPEKYEKALITSVNLCSVERTIKDPPKFETKVMR